MSYLVIHKRAGGWARADLDEHHAFLKRVQGRLVAHGPIMTEEEVSAGHVYFTDHESSSEVSAFVAEDPLSTAAETVYHAWRARLPRRQAEIPLRPGRQGFFMWGLGTRDAPRRREALHAAHAEYFRRFDPDHFVARGPIISSETQGWLGTSVAIEVDNRAAFDTYLHNEPFYSNGLYGQAEIYRWNRGASHFA